jgi:transcription termination/antitermination protein NusG
VSPEENKESKPEEPKTEVPHKAPEPKIEAPKEEDDKPQPVKQSRPRGQEPLPEPEEPKEIFAVKTSIGHEKIVADMIAARAKKRDADVYAILSPQKLRGYVLVEGKGMERLRTLIKGLPKVRGVVQGDKSIALDDILGQLEPTSTVEGINEGDIVELISGPFKGEKARVEQIDKSKEEITVALIEAIVKIPVTVKGEAVRILEKEKEEEK